VLLKSNDVLKRPQEVLAQVRAALQ
jgi:hypothetical protein